VKTRPIKKMWQSERGAATSQARFALGCLDQPGQVASPLNWLLNLTNSWITGDAFSINGGIANVTGNSGKAAN